MSKHKPDDVAWARVKAKMLGLVGQPVTDVGPTPPVYVVLRLKQSITLLELAQQLGCISDAFELSIKQVTLLGGAVKAYGSAWLIVTSDLDETEAMSCIDLARKQCPSFDFAVRKA